MANLTEKAAALWLECVDEPDAGKIKAIGSMQRKFTPSDWGDYLRLIGRL